MSNPAVVKLSQRKIGNSRVWMDDNFGESIHLHIDDIRADLSNVEFENLCEDVMCAINCLIDVEGFDCHYFDPVYLETMLWEKLQFLERIKYDHVKLSELYAPGKRGIVSLPSSRCVRALKGDTKENDNSRRHSTLIGQSNQERLDTMLDSIECNGYPYKNNYIVLYGDDNIIRDGQHRAACLYHLYGDIEVPVVRLFFTNYEMEDIKRSQNTVLRTVSFISAVLSEHGLSGSIRLLLRKLRSVYKNKKRKRFNKVNGKRNSEIEAILLAK